MQEPEPAPQYDVFISYRHQEPDLSWVREKLSPALRRHDLRVCLDVDVFVPGRTLLHQMEAAVVNSRYTIMVISRNYLAGRFAQAEYLMAVSLARREARRTLMAIVLERCDDRAIREQTGFFMDMTVESDFASAMEKLVAAIGSLS